MKQKTISKYRKIMNFYKGLKCNGCPEKAKRIDTVNHFNISEDTFFRAKRVLNS